MTRLVGNVPQQSLPRLQSVSQSREFQSVDDCSPSMRGIRLSTLIVTALFAFLLTGVAMAADVVNLNKADAAAMQQNLIGIGPIKAEDIVSYRKKNGKFKDISDLQNVKGIGPALLKKNKRYLSLSKGAVTGDAKKYAAAKKQAKAKQTGSSSGSKKAASKTSKSKKSETATARSSSSSKSKSATKSKDSSATAKKAKPAKSSKKKSTSKSKTTKKSTKDCDPKKDKGCKPKKKKSKKSKKKKSKTSASTT